MSEVDDVDDGRRADARGRSRRPLTPAQRRARRQTITLLLVGGAAAGRLPLRRGVLRRLVRQAQGHGPPCHLHADDRAVKVKPSQVQVNVYNASSRNGLAKKVAGEMTDCAASSSARSPTTRCTRRSRRRPRSATAPRARPARSSSSSEVPGAKLVEDKRKDASVDLVLGGTYSKLTGGRRAPRRPARPARRPRPRRRPAPPKSTKTTKTSAKPSPTTSKKP